MGRYEDVPESVKMVVRNVKEQWFTELANARIKVLFDLKKKMGGGKMVLGRIQKTNDLLRHLTVDEADSDEGYDYIMYLDKMVFNNIEDEDKIRLVRHELRHCFLDLDARGTPYKLVGHDVEDFEEEIRLNGEEIGWARRCAEIGLSLYEQQE